MITYYDRQGDPITAERYLELFRQREYKIIASDLVGDIRVISSWLGQDQVSWHGEDKRPMIFGTILHHESTDEFDNEWFSATETEALETHRLKVAELQGA